MSQLCYASFWRLVSKSHELCLVSKIPRRTAVGDEMEIEHEIRCMNLIRWVGLNSASCLFYISEMHK